MRYGTSQATVPQRVAVQTSRDLTHLRPDGLPGSRSSFARHAEPPLAEAARDLADYQRLTAEGKLGEAGQKLEELKRVLDKLNTRPK